MTRRYAPEEPEDNGGPLYTKALQASSQRLVALWADERDKLLFGPSTFRDRLAEHFKARPGVWLNGLDLAKQFGAYAWRTRVSECRTQLGMNIENRIRRVGKVKVSEYRWVP